jgi:hypothetical protein
MRGTLTPSTATPGQERGNATETGPRRWLALKKRPLSHCLRYMIMPDAATRTACKTNSSPPALGMSKSAVNSTPRSIAILFVTLFMLHLLTRRLTFRPGRQVEREQNIQPLPKCRAESAGGGQVQARCDASGHRKENDQIYSYTQQQYPA